jgi:hypothetical protein
MEASDLPPAPEPTEPLPSPPWREATKRDAPPTPVMMVGACVCGLIGLAWSIVPFAGIALAPLPALLGIILGAVALRQARTRGGPKGLAMAGLICGLAALVIVVALMEATNGWS